MIQINPGSQLMPRETTCHNPNNLPNPVAIKEIPLNSWDASSSSFLPLTFLLFPDEYSFFFLFLLPMGEICTFEQEQIRSQEFYLKLDTDFKIWQLYYVRIDESLVNVSAHASVSKLVAICCSDRGRDCMGTRYFCEPLELLYPWEGRDILFGC